MCTLGGVTSGATLAIAPNATQREIPMITPTGTEPTITDVGGEYMFRDVLSTHSKVMFLQNMLLKI